MSTPKKSRLGLKLLDALYAEDYGYAQYMISGNPKLVNWKEPSGGNSLLHILSYSNMDKQIRLLLKHKADPNIKNFSGETPLIWATKLRSLKAINVLLTEGSDIRINDTDVSGSTVLHHAAHFGIPEVINVLLEHGADVWIKDCDGMNAYDLVCEGTSPGHVSVASLLYHKFSTRCPPPTSDAMVAQSSAANLSPGKFKRVDSYLAVETALSKHASPLRPHPLFRIIDSRESSSRPATASSIPNFSPIPEISSPTLCKSASTPNNPLFRSATKSKKPTSAFGMSIDKNFNSNSPMKSALKFDKMTVTLSPPDAHVPFVPTNARINQSVFNMTGGASGDADIKLTNNLSLTILFGVEQCHNCENHAWCVWHDEEKYKSNADEALLMCICTFLNRPKLPLTVFGYHSRASKTRLGALELYCSIFVPNGMNMGRFDPENETDPNMYGSTPDKLNGGTWLHHVLHSKLKTKTWPNIASIQENLLAIVEYLFSINNKRSLLSASASESTFTFNLSPVKQNSKRCIVLSPSNSAVDVTMDSRLDYKHMHMEEQYDNWWRRTQPPEEVTEEPPATSRSLKAVEFVLTETNKVDTARSKTSVSSKKLSESDGEEIVAQEPDVDGNRSITDASSKQSELENLSRTTGGITSALMQMAVGMENVKETKKTKTEEVIPPYFIESVKRSSELDPKTNPFQLTKKRKKELISEYELKVLDTFFVFDNSTPSQK